jgi:plastocyanin
MRALLLLALPLVLAGCPSEKKEEPKPVAPPVTPPPPAPPETPPPPPPAEPPAGGGPGTIQGIISFKGAAPAPEKVDMKKDPKCVDINKAQEIATVAVKDGKLADVFVRIAEGLPADGKFDTRSDAITLDQKGCVYSPQMLAVQIGQPLKILNSDPLLHNVHAHAKRGEFNQAMPTQGMTLEKKFKTKDLEGKITCEVHPWMHANLRVVDHPFFAVSGGDGSFTIQNVPAGKYKLELEHGKLGKKTVDVEVTAGGTAQANVDFGG